MTELDPVEWLMALVGAGILLYAVGVSIWAAAVIPLILMALSHAVEGAAIMIIGSDEDPPDDKPPR
jgi:hypothetical protein